MHGQFGSWTARIPITDTLRYQQARTLQAFMFILIAATVLGIPLSLSAASAIDRTVGVASTLIQLALLVVSLALLRRGFFMIALVLLVVNLILFAALNMAPTGLEGSRAIFTLLAVPMILGGLLGGRQILVFSTILTILLVVGIAILSVFAPALVGYSVQTYDPVLTGLTYTIIAVLLGVLVDRFSTILRQALDRAYEREKELEALQASLERQVQERTASLQATVEELQTSQATIGKLGAPILPVLPGVLVAPLIGMFDAARVAHLTERVLSKVAEQRSTTVIFDITGMEFVDTQTSMKLILVSDAVRLLGAEPVIVGIAPDIARMLIEQGVELNVRRIYANLQEAVEVLQSRRTAA